MKSIFQVLTFDVIAKVVMGVSGILVIRYMAPTEYAGYTVAIAAAGVATQVLSNAVNRVYIVGHRRVAVSDPLHAMLGFQLFAIAGGGLVAAPFLAGDALTGVLVVVLIAAICMSEFAKTVYQRDLRFTPFSMVEVGRSGLFFLGLLGLVAYAGQGMRAWHVLLLQAAAFLLVFGVAIGRKVRWRAVFDTADAAALGRAMVRGAYRALFAYFILHSILSQVNIGLLRLFSDDLQLASYGSAYRYYALILLALAAVDKVLLPYVQAAEDGEQVRRVLSRTMRAAGFLAGPVLVGAWAAQWVLPAIDMGKYPAAVPTFQILAVSAVLALAFSPYANLLMRHEDFRFLFRLAGASLLINVVLAVPLIRMYGSPGAAAALWLAYFVMNGGTYLRARTFLAAEPSRPASTLHAVAL